MPQKTPTHTQAAKSHQAPVVIHRIMDAHCSAVTGRPESTIVQRIFFNLFLSFIRYAISPMESTEKLSLPFTSRLMLSIISSLFWDSEISSRRACDCRSSRIDISFSGCSSQNSSFILLMGNPASRKKHMTCIFLRSCSE